MTELIGMLPKEKYIRQQKENIVKSDAKKKSLTSTEMNIIKDIYFGVDSQITVLCPKGEFSSQKREGVCGLQWHL